MKRKYDCGYDSDASYDEKKLVEGQARLRQLSSYQYEVHPYNSIGLVLTYIGGRPFASTGTLLSSNVVLTTAHSIISISEDNEIIKPKPKDMVFYAHFNGELQKSEGSKVVDYRLCQQYQQIILKRQKLNSHKQDIRAGSLTGTERQKKLKQIKSQLNQLKKQSAKFDYALLKIEKGILLEEYVPLRTLEPKENFIVELCGYIYNGREYNLYQTWVDKNQLNPTIQVTSTGGLYDMDTNQGQSGSPVFLKQAKRQIVGIHKGYDPVNKKNTCTLVSARMFLDLQRWTKQFFFFKTSNLANSSPLKQKHIQAQQSLIYKENEQLLKENKVLKQKIQELQPIRKEYPYGKQQTLLNSELQAEKYYIQALQSKQASLIEDYCLKTIALNSSHKKALSKLASIYLNTNRLKDAQKLFSKLIQLDPNNSNAYCGLGVVCLRLNRQKQTEELFKKSIQLNPNYADAYYNIGVFYSRENRLKQAQQSYRKAVKLNPNELNAHLCLASVCFRTQQLKQSQKFYRLAIELDPNSSQAIHGLGCVFLFRNQLKEAQQYLRKAIQINPNQPKYYQNLNILLDKLNQ